MVEVLKNDLLQLANEVRNNLKPTPNYIMPINDYPHLFLLGSIMDRQIPYDKAWNIPIQIADEIGSKDFAYFLDKNKQFYINLFEQNKYHRFNHDMAVCFYEAIQKINTDYKGDAANIWRDNPTSSVLMERLMSFKGVGPSIAAMVVNILDRRKIINLAERKGLDISPDRNVKRVMHRMGLIYTNSDSDAKKAARRLSPDFPGLLDKLFWKVGKEYCLDQVKKCSNCIISKYCEKHY